MVLSSQRLRVGVVLERAMSRRSMRDASIRERDVELVIISSTGNAITSRRANQRLDRIVIDVNAAAAGSAIETIRASGEERILLLVSNDPADSQRRYGIPRERILAEPPDDSAVGDVIIARLRELVPTLRSSGAGEVPAALRDGSAPAPRPGIGRPSGLRPALDRLVAEQSSNPGQPNNGTPTPSRPGSRPGPSFRASHRRDLVVIGASTGGPEALAAVLRQLPPNFPAPVLVVQHMPPNFTKMLADRLDRSCALTVREVSEAVTVRRGEVWIAPGGRHIKVANAAGRVEPDDGPAENSCRPSVDVLFRTAAQHYADRSIAVMLTGMGDDGRRGTENLRDAGAHVIAQDEATSVVWGMPGAVVKAGLADDVAPLPDVASVLCDQFLGAVVQPV